MMGRMEREGASEDMRKNRLNNINNLWKLYISEESKWLQKARVRWLKEGDKIQSSSTEYARPGRQKRSKSDLC